MPCVRQKVGGIPVPVQQASILQQGGSFPNTHTLARALSLSHTHTLHTHARCRTCFPAAAAGAAASPVSGQWERTQRWTGQVNHCRGSVHYHTLCFSL